ncbi:MAG: hypothetical protein JXO22_15695 [Phycisphaerae bacterium]|nr:hypothetical protein [Phycisphaerae bacterium]
MPTFEEYNEGSLRVVRVRRSVDVVTYWIDPDRGWAPVRVRKESTVYGGWSESRSSLELVDGVWYPVAVEYYSSRFRGGAEPERAVRVLEAEFNRVEHPSRMTVADIGLESGMPVFYEAEDGKQKIGMWDGHRPVTPSEFSRRAQTGELTMSERFVRAAAERQEENTRNIDQITEQAKSENVLAYVQLGVGALGALCMQDAPAGHTASLWEAYVRAFIKEYRLNQQQAAKALAVLHECQNLATRLVNRRLPAVEALERRVDEAERAEQPHEEASLELDKAKAAIHQGTRDIFESKLKPRLDRLPTPEQRQAFEARRSE